MHPVSKFALALSLGAFSMVSVAHAADSKDKGKAAPAPQPGQNYSPEFQKTYFAVAPLLADKDNKGNPIKPEKVQENLLKAKAAWPSIQAAAVNDDDKATAGRFATALGGKLKDAALMRQGVEMAYASPSLPANLRQDFGYEKSNYAYADKDYATAERLRIEAFNAGYKGADVEYGIALAQFNQKKYADALGWMEKAFAAKAAENKGVPAIWYGVAGDSASKLNDWNKGNSYYAKMVATENTPGYWYAALETYRRYDHTSGEPLLDLYRLMRRTGALNSSADSYYGYIEILDQHRYPTETKAVVADGIKANKLTATAPVVAAALKRSEEKTAEYLASLPEAEANARASKSGFDAMLAGDDLLSNSDYAKARDMYALALSRGPVKANDGSDATGEATLRLGITKLELGDMAGAKAEFSKLNNGELAPIANYWLIHIGHLESGKSAS